MSVRMLYQDPYFEAAIHPARPDVVRIARTEQPFVSLAAARDSYAGLARALDVLDCASRGGLLDLRRARGRHEPEFERFAADSSAAILRRFRAAAILVKSVVGRLQVQRIEKERGEREASVFNDELEALAHVGA